MDNVKKHRREILLSIVAIVQASYEQTNKNCKVLALVEYT